MRALVVGLVAIAPLAHAERLVVVAPDPAFHAALEDTFVPAGATIDRAPELAAPALGDLAPASRKLADAGGATATVWLLPAGTGATLVAYDRAVDRVLVRELPYSTPLTPTQAAEASLMVRTMLRALRVPDRDPLPPAPDDPKRPIGPTVAKPWLAASAGAGVWFAAPAATASLSAQLAVAWRPHGLGAAVTAAFAPSADVMTTSFAGSVRDIVLAAEARAALPLAPRLHVTPALGLALHAVRLTGTIGNGESTDSSRYDPALRAGATLGYELRTGLDLGLAVSADGLLRRQRYAAGTEEILVVPRVQILTAITVGIRL